MKLPALGQSRWSKWLACKHYIWLLPSGLLIFGILFVPMVQTLVTSFCEPVTFSESAFRSEFKKLVFQISGKQIDYHDKIDSIPAWESLIGAVAKHYNVYISPEEITSEMNVRETIEALSSLVQVKQGQDERVFAGLNNYKRLFRDPLILIAFKNTIRWLLLFVTLTVVLGMLIAVLAEKVRWSKFAKTVVFMPMAISFVASAIIWALMFDQNSNIGIINAAIRILHSFFDSGKTSSQGVAFLGRPDTVNYSLIIAGTWMWVGYCAVFFGAALQAIPKDLLEAATMEGATSLQTFFMVELPLIRPTLMLVTTTMFIVVLKTFDIVYTLTGGGPYGSSEVLASRMYYSAFNNGDMEQASAIAVILLVAVLPIVALNVKSFLSEDNFRE